MILELLRSLSIPNLRAHPTRTLVTILGVGLGVAAFVAIGSVNDSVIASFQHRLRTVAGDSEIEIGPAAGALSEDLVDRIAAVPRVGAAAGMIETVVAVADDASESLYLLGIDFLGSPVWSTQFPRAAMEIPDELLFVAQPTSVVLTRAFAARRGVGLGDSVRISTPGGIRTLHVRGLLDDVSAARLFGGALAVMDLPAAMEQLGRKRTVDRVLVTLDDSADREQVRERLRAALGPGIEVRAPEERGAQAEKLLVSLRAMLATTAFLSLVIGGFIVYHTVEVAIGQRRRQFALANAVGISRRALAAMCVVETVALAAVGIVLGLLMGQGLGTLAAPLVGTAASEIWLRVDAAYQPRLLGEIAIGTVMGVTVAIVAGALAIRATFRSPTVEALRPVGAAAGDEHVRGWFAVAGLAGIAGGAGLGLLPLDVHPSALVAAIDAVDAAGIIGAAAVAAPLVVGMGRLAHRLTSRSRHVPLHLAAIHLPLSPRRGGATVATIAAALAITSALAVLIESFRGAWLDWIEQHFAADLLVGSGARVRLLTGPAMAPGVADAIRSIDGVASVEPFRVLSIQLGDRPIFLQGISIPDRLQRGGLPMVEGTLERAAADLEAGTAVLLSDNLAFKLGLHAGDHIVLPSPSGALRLRIAGTFVDFLGSPRCGGRRRRRAAHSLAR